jgi:hypothetical protein
VYNSFLLPKAHSAFSVALSLSSVFFFIFNFFLEIWYLIIVYFASPHGRKKKILIESILIKATQWSEEEEEDQISFVYIK